MPNTKNPYLKTPSLHFLTSVLIELLNFEQYDRHPCSEVRAAVIRKYNCKTNWMHKLLRCDSFMELKGCMSVIKIILFIYCKAKALKAWLWAFLLSLQWWLAMPRCHWTCFQTALSQTLPLLPSLAYAVDTLKIVCCSFVCQRMMLKYKTGFNGIIGQVFGLVQECTFSLYLNTKVTPV